MGSRKLSTEINESDERTSFSDPAPVNPQPVDFVLHDEVTGEARRLHGRNYELEATFDFFKGNLRLVESLHDQAIWPETLRKEAIFFNRSNSSFLNLEGLSDNSLLFSFRPESIIKANSVNKPRQRHQTYDFICDTVDSPLSNAILHCASEHRTLCLRLPKARHKGWKTIALILLTYRKITPKVWYGMVTNEKLVDVAGFDWRHLCQIP